MKNEARKTTAELNLTNPYKVGDGITLCGYSDSEAYTVIKVTPKSVTMQRDKATLLNGMNSGEEDALVMHEGGFVGHVEGTQRYSYERDPNGYIEVARMKKYPKKVIELSIDEDGNEHYEHNVLKPDFTANGKRVIEGRKEHYDYNF